MRRVLVFAAIATTVLLPTAASAHAAEPPARSINCGSALQAGETAGPIEARVGDVILDRGAGVEVPEPGHGVTGADYKVDGADSLTVTTQADGTVRVENCGPDEDEPSTIERLRRGPRAKAASSPSACSDTAYNLFGFEWDHNYHWYLDKASRPSNLGGSATEDAVYKGIRAVAIAHNNCGMPDNVSAGQNYDGNSAGAVQINSNNSCESSGDSTNRVRFGDLRSTSLGFACIWTSGGVPDTADIKFNKQEFEWNPVGGGAGCTTKYSVRSTTTHEAGHVFGLDHVGETNHGNLTMSAASNGPCQDSEYTFGKGDILGLRQLY